MSIVAFADRGTRGQVASDSRIGQSRRHQLLELHQLAVKKVAAFFGYS